MTHLPVLDPLHVEAAVRAALLEDFGRAGDITSMATIPAGKAATAVFNAREPGVVSGLALACAAFQALDANVRFEALVADGAQVGKGVALARVSGPARAILGGERVALNYLGRLCGIATLTAAYVARVAHTARKSATRARRRRGCGRSRNTRCAAAAA